MPRKKNYKKKLSVSEPKINNIVCTSYLSTTLYLPALIRIIDYAEFNAKKFAAITLRVHDPEATLLLFGSGNIVCAGCKTIEEGRVVILQTLFLIRKLYPKARVYKFEVQNIVATCSFRQECVSLPKIHEHYGMQSNYEPQLFPGLVFRSLHRKTKQVYLLFSSGKCVITGSKNQEQIAEAFKHLREIVNNTYICNS